MTIRSPQIFFALIVLFSTSLAQGSEPADDLELIVVSKNVAARWRLRISIEGIPAVTARRGVLTRLLQFYDHDRDGQLTAQEAILPTPFGWRQLASGRVVPSAAAVTGESLDDNGVVTVRGLESYYKKSGVTAGCFVALAASPSSVELNAAMLKAMQLPASKPWTRDAVEAGALRLAELDSDGDGLVSATELLPLTSYPGSQATTLLEPGRLADGCPVMVLPATGDPSWVRTLMKELDKNGDGLLQANEFAPQGARFAALDRNRDGAIDLDELARWRLSPPAIVLEIRVSPQGVVLRECTGECTAKRAAFRASCVGCDVRVHGRWEPQTAAIGHITALAGQFSELAGGDQAPVPTTALEGLVNRVELERFARLADANHDSRISPVEAQKWRDLIVDALRFQCTLAVVDYGAALFACLDRNNDGALSATERKQSWDSLQAAGAVRHGDAALASVPRQLRFVVSNASPRSLLDQSHTAGPPWFAAMDRNSDGAVSPGEFLASEQQFRQLDQDKDGLITAEEASTAAEQ